MKNKKKNKLIAILAALTLFSGASFASTTYAWWNTLQVAKDETVRLSEGVAVTVDAAVTTDKALVPVGTLYNSDLQTESVILTYNVAFNKEVTETFSLGIEISNVKINGTATYANLVNFVIYAPTTVNKDGAVVAIKVTLTEPDTEAIYNAIANKEITFTITFTTALA